MNTKKIIAFLLSVSILITMGTFSLSAAAFAGGSGTEEDPFLIETAAQLDEVRQQPAAWYKMVTNITLSGAWTPIGADETAPFTGHFDGNGYAIAGLSVSAANSPTYYGGWSKGRWTSVPPIMPPRSMWEALRAIIKERWKTVSALPPSMPSVPILMQAVLRVTISVLF